MGGGNPFKWLMDPLNISGAFGDEDTAKTQEPQVMRPPTIVTYEEVDGRDVVKATPKKRSLLTQGSSNTSSENSALTKKRNQDVNSFYY